MNKNKEMILKVQIPLLSNAENPVALIYNQSRNFMTNIPITELLMKLMRGEYKLFFYGYYDEDIEDLIFTSEAEFQDW